MDEITVIDSGSAILKTERNFPNKDKEYIWFEKSENMFIIIAKKKNKTLVKFKKKEFKKPNGRKAQVEVFVKNSQLQARRLK